MDHPQTAAHVAIHIVKPLHKKYGVDIHDTPITPKVTAALVNEVYENRMNFKQVEEMMDFMLHVYKRIGADER